MNKFINRIAELEFLESIYASSGFQFVPIYGRRRIGKTELVKEFLKNKKGIYYLADTLAEKDQLVFLGKSVGEFFDDMILKEQGFNDWYSFFKYLKLKTPALKMKEKLVVVIDEFPYLARTNSAISSVFQKGIDDYLKETDIFLILLGSSIGMMEKEVLNYKAPLYGRRTGSLKVEEMPFFEIKDFFPDKSCEELLDIYTVCGMVPGYMSRYEDVENFDDFLLKKVFKKGSFFYEESEMILREDFYEPKTYYSILRAISLGRRKLNEIMGETGLEKSKISKYLKTLQDLLVVGREVPVTEKNPEKSKKGLFFIRDKYLNFWFRFVLGNKSYIEIDRFRPRFDKVKQQIKDHQGFLFEDVCRQYLLGHVDRYEFQTIGRWWEREDEIDLVAVDEEKSRFIFAECKYRNKIIDVDVLKDLKEKVKKVKWHKPFEIGKVVIFSRLGFTDRLKALEEKEKTLELVAFREMF
ncbi:MAG: AAA family ATPase [Candidatus Aminicenantes bacterium]|nr:AAA family ATPase [Candidatus Aminicenantes bacterium]NIM80804.1 AAA family ATPase [Candidatus Aminicenantes bacterium]NIN20187.1 AAA family ATPase [Candidatus Aminicenantes bacterium]NIN43966.1 AAA family ATPase [Candidatus Aminicenantes bacterium]NIN86775.1 AAA family ATPase [Candidatus Aminicenantes bacterium]